MGRLEEGREEGGWENERRERGGVKIQGFRGSGFRVSGFLGSRKGEWTMAFQDSRVLGFYFFMGAGL